MIRVFAGGAAVGISISYWMTIIVFLLAISIGFAKRRDDLVIEKGDVYRKSQSGYTIAFLDVAKSISLAVTLMAYVMYTISDEVIQRIGTDKLYFTAFFVFLGILRYIQVTIVEQESGSPVEVLSKDRFLQVVLIFWVFSFTFILYGNSVVRFFGM